MSATNVTLLFSTKLSLPGRSVTSKFPLGRKAIAQGVSRFLAIIEKSGIFSWGVLVGIKLLTVGTEIFSDFEKVLKAINTKPNDNCGQKIFHICSSCHPFRF
jgi:hypothetical protein